MRRTENAYYEPNAIGLSNHNGEIKVTRLFTYSSCFSWLEAQEVIRKWSEQYDLVSSYIRNTKTGRKVSVEFFEDNLRHYEWGCD